MLVELVVRYSNREDALNQLFVVLERIRADNQSDEPGARTVERSPRGSAKLTSEDVHPLVAALCSGTVKRTLAKRYSNGATKAIEVSLLRGF
jgi:hypothetical protein